MESVESEEVMTFGCGNLYGGRSCMRRGLYTVPGVDRRSWAEITILGGSSLFIRKKQGGVGLSSYDEKALTVAHRKGLISHGAFVQN